MSPADRASRGRSRRSTPTVRRWLAVAAWMALLFVLSAQPGLRISDDAAADAAARAVAHVLAYAVLGALLLVALADRERSGRRSAASAVILAGLYGVSDELHQALVADRSGQLEDVALDVVGAMAGVTAVLVFQRARERSTRASQRPEPDTAGAPRSARPTRPDRR